MKVILLENVKRIGSIGEVIDVKRGFARNYLIANKKALYASKENIREVEKIKIDLSKKDFHELERLEYQRRFISENGKILANKYTRLSAKDQRKLTRAVKKARILGILPYTDKHRTQQVK